MISKIYAALVPRQFIEQLSQASHGQITKLESDAVSAHESFDENQNAMSLVLDTFSDNGISFTVKSTCSCAVAGFDEIWVILSN